MDQVQPFHVMLGTIVLACGVMGFLWRILVSVRETNSIMEKFLIEHEILILDYCKRLGIEVKDLPTRMKGLSDRR